MLLVSLSLLPVLSLDVTKKEKVLEITFKNLYCSCIAITKDFGKRRKGKKKPHKESFPSFHSLGSLNSIRNEEGDQKLSGNEKEDLSRLSLH